MRLITSNGTCISQIMSSNNPLLLTYRNNYIMIDTGRRGKQNTILDRVEKQLKGNSLSAIILTHAHHDHVENIAAIKNNFSPAIIAHRSEVKYVQSGKSCPSVYSEKTGDTPHMEFNYEPANVDIVVGEYMDLADFGFKAYILWTPGHSTGSLSVIINDEVAITGDALEGMESKAFHKNIYVASSEKETSWRKLMELKCKQYIPSHSDAMSYDKLFETYSAYLKEAKDNVIS